MQDTKHTTQLARRKFFSQCAQAAAAVGLVGTLLGATAQRSKSLPAVALRPPGALSTDDFLAACVRCGLCVRDCPYDTLRLAELAGPVAAGTPYFVARDVPCEMCADVPCAAACPTGALAQDLSDIRHAKMGLAVLTGPDTCYSINRGSCRACYMACPIRDDAITMELKHENGWVFYEPTVHREHCTGCGKCEAHCVTEKASIKVLPIDLVREDFGLRMA